MLLLRLAVLSVAVASALQPGAPASRPSTATQRPLAATPLAAAARDDDDASGGALSRRDLGLGWAAAGVGLVLGSGVAEPAAVAAAEGEGRKWISGKSEVPKEKGDTKGTKKDTSFLRCLSNCVSDCAAGARKGLAEKVGRATSRRRAKTYATQLLAPSQPLTTTSPPHPGPRPVPAGVPGRVLHDLRAVHRHAQP